MLMLGHKEMYIFDGIKMVLLYFSTLYTVIYILLKNGGLILCKDQLFCKHQNQILKGCSDGCTYNL